MKVIPKGPLQQTRDSAFQPGALAMYENDGAPLLAAIVAFRKDKYLLINERGREVELPANRLYALPGRLPSDLNGSEQKGAWLSDLHKNALQEAESIDLEDLWAVLKENERDYSCKDCCELFFSDTELMHSLSMRLKLMTDRIFFKRNKDEYAPRPESTVEELKKAETARREKEQARTVTFEAFKRRLANHSAELPPESASFIRLLEDTAAYLQLEHGRQKEVKELLEQSGQILGLQLNGTREQQAFSLLQQIGHFNENTNLSLVRYRPALSFSKEAEAEAAALHVPARLEDYPAADQRVRLDCSTLQVFTIDDVSTRDMDDGLSLEMTPAGYRLGVHVSDVAAILPAGSLLDREVGGRATSIYIPERTIHMLPSSLAANKLSLVAGQPRPCLSCFFEFNRNLELLSSSIAPTLVKVARRYNYEEVDEILESADPGSLGIIYNITVNEEAKRLENGAQKVFKHDLIIKVTEQGKVELLEYDEHGPARGLVGETMIMANALLAAYAGKNGLAVAYRSQEPPEDDTEEPADIPHGPAYDYAMRARLKKSSVSITPAPHAGLGLKAYIQATSPIRRYLDLCNQRQILEHLRSGKPLYSPEEFERLMMESEEPLSDAVLIQKESRRFWLQRYLQQRSNQRNASGERNNLIKATVLRTDLKNPLVELDEVFMPTIVRTSKPVKPGDVLTLRLAAIDPRADYMKIEVV